jgi:uncharacterized protein (DUF1499 family)
MIECILKVDGVDSTQQQLTCHDVRECTMAQANSSIHSIAMLTTGSTALEVLSLTMLQE